MNQVLHTDSEFMRLCVPADLEKREKLESSLMRQGCLEPIITWRGLILDGHKRYEICTYEEISFDTAESAFQSREEAIIWVCKERISGLRKATAIYRYLVGKWYICQKKINKIQRKEARNYIREIGTADDSISEPWDRASLWLAADIGIHRATVERYGSYAESMDMIFQKVPAMFMVVIAGEIHFPLKEIHDIARLDEKDIYNILRKLHKKDGVKMRNRSSQNKEHDTVEEIRLSVGVKEMPAFDPDMELRGLTLTIPVWMSTIARAEKQTDMTKASEEAKNQLLFTLMKLDEQIQKTLEVLR